MTRVLALAAAAAFVLPAGHASATCQEPICNSVCIQVHRAWFAVQSTLDPSPPQPSLEPVCR